MSRGVKILWIIVGSLFAMGVVLTAVGFTLGATGRIWFNNQGLHFGDREIITREFVERSSEPFDQIDINLAQVNVEIVSADSYGYEFNYVGAQEPRVRITGEKLDISEDDNWYIGILNFWELWSEESQLTIYVPEEAMLERVSIFTAGGNTMINDDQINIRDLNCVSVSGNVELSSLELEQLNLDMASGSAQLESVSAERATIEMASGRLIYDDAKLATVNLNMASGSIDFTGEVTQTLQLNMVSGTANFNLVGNEDDFWYEIDDIGGTVRINGRVVGESFWPDSIESPGNSSSNAGRILLDTVSGTVNIDFTER